MTIRPMSKVQHRVLRRFFLQGQDFPPEIYDPLDDTPNNTNPLNALMHRGMVTKVSKPLSEEARREYRKLGWHKEEINFKDPAYYNIQEVIWWGGEWIPFANFQEDFLYTLTPQGLAWCQERVDLETLEIIYRPSINPYGCRGKPDHLLRAPERSKRLKRKNQNQDK